MIQEIWRVHKYVNPFIFSFYHEEHFFLLDLISEAFCNNNFLMFPEMKNLLQI